MVQSNRNFIIAYILLVGLPVLGLIGVLKTGRSSCCADLARRHLDTASRFFTLSIPTLRKVAGEFRLFDFTVRRNFYAEHNDRTKIHRVRRSRWNHLEGFAVPVSVRRSGLRPRA